MLNLEGFLFYIFVLVFSVVIHEVSHGLVARQLGDDTAEAAGRLTLNPLKHIDPFGSVLLPLLLYIAHLPGIAWAKPVPYNPYKLFKDFKFGPLKVALAGPISNIGLVILASLLARLAAGWNPIMAGLLGLVAFLNCFLAVFNLLPIPPLDGSKILPLIFPRYAAQIERIGFFGVIFIFIFIYIFSGLVSTVAGYIFVFFAGPNVTDLTFQVLALLGFGS